MWVGMEKEIRTRFHYGAWSENAGGKIHISDCDLDLCRCFNYIGKVRRLNQLLLLFPRQIIVGSNGRSAVDT